MDNENHELLSELRNMIASTASEPINWMPNADFEKLVLPDEDLGAIVGCDPMTRGELAKRLWSYIRLNGLQDRNDWKAINANGSVAKLLHGEVQTTALKLMTTILEHVT